MTGDLATAERANVHYLIALELVGDNARFRATILGELGLLHTDVGNYRIALGYLLDRDKLPSMDNAEGLDVLLSKAQALLHVGRDRDAAAAAEAAIAMIGRNPALGPYRTLALDWAAVDNLAAGSFPRALAELYGAGRFRSSTPRGRRSQNAIESSPTYREPQPRSAPESPRVLFRTSTTWTPRSAIRRWRRSCVGLTRARSTSFARIG